jgi:hypothetical protein
MKVLRFLRAFLRRCSRCRSSVDLPSSVSAAVFLSLLSCVTPSRFLSLVSDLPCPDYSLDESTVRELASELPRANELEFLDLFGMVAPLARCLLVYPAHPPGRSGGPWQW